MKRLLLTAFAVLTTAAVLPASGAPKSNPIDGNWSGLWPANTPFAVTLIANGKALNGTCRYDMGVAPFLRDNPANSKPVKAEQPIEAGRVNGKKVEFGCNFLGPEGQPNVVRFKGTLDHDKLTLAAQPPVSETKSFTMLREPATK